MSDLPLAVEYERSKAEEAFDALLMRLPAKVALDLRVARLLGWIKAANLPEQGYGGFTNFCRERVDWGETWLRQLVRLATSGLQRVQAAACLGMLPLTAAVCAPGLITQEQEEKWLAEALQGRVERIAPRRRPATVDLEGDDLQVVTAARSLARKCIGRKVSTATLDWFIVDHFNARTSGQDILDRAQQKREPPPPLPPAYGGEDLATPLVGTWEEPTGLTDAISKLNDALTARRERVRLIGALFASLAEKGRYRLLEFPTLEALARRLGVSKRTLERYREVAFAYQEPAVAESGLDLARVELVAQAADEETLAEWLFLARYTGVGELTRAVAMARDVPGTLAIYLAAARAAGVGATGSAGAPAEPIRRIALTGSHRPVRAPRYDRVHVQLLEASRWFLENVRPEPQKGFGRVKERDDFTCQNPECGCQTLRCHAHHITFRSRGGTDDPENGICVCPSCHLRLIHAGHVKVSRVGAFTRWVYPGREVWVA